jgi:hypothetical protein
MFDPTFMLRIAGRTQQRSGSAFTAAEFASTARSLGLAQGYVDSAIPTLSQADQVLAQMIEQGLARRQGRRWQLTDTAQQQLLEMSDEHTEDVDSLLSFLDREAL